MALRLRCFLPLLVAASAFASGRPISPPVIGPTGDLVGMASTAFASGRFLTVWSHQQAGDGQHIYGAFSDGSGRRISGSAVRIVADANTNPNIGGIRLLTVEDEFVLFWLDRGHLKMAHLDRGGVVLRTKAVAVDAIYSFDAAWNGKQFALAVRGDRGRTEAVLLDSDGDVVRAGMALHPQAYAFDVTAAGSDFFILSSGFSFGVAYRWLGDEADTPLTTGEEAVDASANEDGSIVVAWFGNETGLIRRGEPIVKQALPAPPGTRAFHLTMFTAPGGHGVYASGIGGTFVYDVDASGRAEGAPRHFDVSGRVTAAADGTAILIPQTTGGRPQIESIAIRGAEAAPPEVLSLTPSWHSGPMQAVTTPAGALVAWRDNTRESTTAWAILDGNGDRITDVRHAGELLDLAGNGVDALLVVRSADGGVDLLRVRPDGEPIGRTRLPAEMWVSVAAAAWSGTQYVVVWSEGARLRGITCGAEGTTGTPWSVPGLPLPPSTQRYINAVDLAFAAATGLCVWTEIQSGPYASPSHPPTAASAFVRLSADGGIVDTVPTPLGGILNVRVAASDREFLLISSDVDVRALMVSSERDVPPGQPQTILASNERAVAAALWDGKNFIVAFRYQARLALARLSRDGRIVAPIEGAETGVMWMNIPTAPAIVSMPDSRIVIAIVERLDVLGLRATAWLESDLHIVQPARRRAAQQPAGARSSM